MSADIPIDSSLREELIDAMEDYLKNVVTDLMSPRGMEYLQNKRKNFDQQKYLQAMMKSKDDTRDMITKLENNQMFTENLISKIQARFEYILVDIFKQMSLYDGDEFLSELQEKFEKYKSLYQKMYPDSDYDFDAVLDGKYPYS